jgi:heme-degrading monooxygenase HmoA
MSRFTVANGMATEVAAAFRLRPHLVDQAPGFRRMEVLCPVGRPEEFLLITHWDEREHFEHWHRGHGYRDSHTGIPKGLKLVPEETEIRFFDVVAE